MGDRDGDQHAVEEAGAGAVPDREQRSRRTGQCSGGRVLGPAADGHEDVLELRDALAGGRVA
jgi:hypothetical protein